MHLRVPALQALDASDELGFRDGQEPAWPRVAARFWAEDATAVPLMAGLWRDFK